MRPRPNRRLTRYQVAVLLGGAIMLGRFCLLPVVLAFPNPPFWVLTPGSSLLAILGLPGERSASVGFGLLAADLLCFIGVAWLALFTKSPDSSRGFKVAVALCALLVVGTCVGLGRHAGRVDWTSRGLNPDHPRWQPEGLVLAGTFESQGAYVPGGRFEIRLRGRDLCYAVRWSGSRRTSQAREEILLATPGSHAYRSRFSKGMFGMGGGGGIYETNYPGLLIGQRLWDGDTLIGATDTNAVAVTNSFNGKEESERFVKLKQVGRWQVPEVIEYRADGRVETLRVRRIEFDCRPSAEWFQLIKRKYFEPDPANRWLRNTNLSEAGWAGEDFWRGRP